MTTFSKYHHLSWLLLLLPMYLFLFVKLGAPHIRLWDEGWFSVHAVEMWKQGSWFVTYFDDVPSFQSSKPPLQSWLQIISLNLFGVSELALRLPSAIAASFTVFLVYFFVRNNSSSQNGLTAAMVLLTSIGFIGYHTARGAEADSLLTLALLIQAISFFQFTQSKDWKWFGVFTLAIGMAFWVKSMAGFLILPGLLIYTLLFHRDLVPYMLKSWKPYLGALAVSAMVFGYVWLRERAQPGYIGMFLKSNVGRYASSVGHDHGLLYYLEGLIQTRYVWWFSIAVIGMVLTAFLDSNAKSIYLFATVCAVSYFLVITFSKSKLVWYDMPFYPLAAIPTAFGINQLVKGVGGWKKSVFLIALFVFPVYHMFSHTQSNSLNLTEMNFESQEIYLNRAFNRGDNLNNLIVVHDHFNGSLIFYRHKFETRDQTLLLQHNLKGLALNDSILVRSDNHKNELRNKFQLEKLDEYKSAVMFRITGLKPHKTTK